MSRVLFLLGLLISLPSFALVPPTEGTFSTGEDDVVVEKHGDGFIVYVLATEFSAKRISCSFEGIGKPLGTYLLHTKAFQGEAEGCELSLAFVDENTVSVLGESSGKCAARCTGKPEDFFVIDRAKRSK